MEGKARPTCHQLCFFFWCCLWMWRDPGPYAHSFTCFRGQRSNSDSRDQTASSLPSLRNHTQTSPRKSFPLCSLSVFKPRVWFVSRVDWQHPKVWRDSASETLSEGRWQTTSHSPGMCLPLLPLFLITLFLRLPVKKKQFREKISCFCCCFFLCQRHKIVFSLPVYLIFNPYPSKRAK